MGPEINIDSILALEKQIEQGLGNIVQLKRTRNSLLNISARVPPELLGQVFRWNVIPEYLFGELERGSYNFLLVCHHWFEIASNTPEVWTYWGNTLKQWSQCYQRSGTTPIDLTLRTNPPLYDKNAGIHFHGPLRDALRDRAACNLIRSIHLRGWDVDLLRSVIASLTVDGEDIRDNNVESLRVEGTDLDISIFLARYRFPKLRVLRLRMGVIISTWDFLKFQATSLTTLSLEFTETSGSPTTSQLLSILATYPNLQELFLREATIPHDIDDRSTTQLSLRCLKKKLWLTGDFSRVIRLLERLEYPDTLDSVYLNLSECAAGVTSDFLEHYLRDRIQRDNRFRGRLKLRVFCASNYISFDINTLGEFNTPPMQPENNYPSIWFSGQLRDKIPRGGGAKLCTDLIASIPRERVVDLMVGFDAYTMKNLLVTMPNIGSPCPTGFAVSDTPLQPGPRSEKKLLPSLRHLHLKYFTQQDNDWGALVAYLTHQTSGGQTISLRLQWGNPPVPPEVVEEVEGLVDKVILG